MKVHIRTETGPGAVTEGGGGSVADEAGTSTGELAGRFVALRRWQAGAFSRAQANAHGISDKVLTARRRARQIQRVHHGVYVDFTGPVPWRSRVWAAWLAYGPDAALGGETALRQYGLDGNWDERKVHVEVPHARRVDRQPGVVISRRQDLAGRLHKSRDPLTVRLEVALLTVASRQSRTDQVLAIVLDACRQGRTTPERLLDDLDWLCRIPRRRLLRQILSDAADGAHSFLEQTYMRRVERAHGLPPGQRQVRAGGTTFTPLEAEPGLEVEPRLEDSADTEDGPPIQVVYRDVEYVPYGVIVELDGRAGHADVGSQWRDMSRDNAAALEGKVTLRFGYQLVAEPCATAAQVGLALRGRGWAGSALSCGSTCST
jgi:hypothetical protein